MAVAPPARPPSLVPPQITASDAILQGEEETEVPTDVTTVVTTATINMHGGGARTNKCRRQRVVGVALLLVLQFLLHQAAGEPGKENHKGEIEGEREIERERDLPNGTNRVCFPLCVTVWPPEMRRG